MRTANVISVDKNDGCISLFDKVTIFNEKLGKEKQIQLVTTLRQNALLGFVSKESPLGEAIMGKRVGDRVEVVVNSTTSYYVRIIAHEKGEDNEQLPISGF